VTSTRAESARSASAAEPVDRAVELYTEQRWLRAAVQLVPFGVGSAIDALITTRGGELARRRVESLLEDLRTAIDQVGQDKVDRAFVGSEEWDDLVIRAFRAAAETRDREKLRILAAILGGSASVERDPALDAEALLSAVTELSPADVELARVLHERLSAPRTETEAGMNELQLWTARLEGDEWIPPAARDDRTFHFHRLEQAGLISEITGSYLSYGGGAYRLTPTLVRLMALVEQFVPPPAAPPADDQ